MPVGNTTGSIDPIKFLVQCRKNLYLVMVQHNDISKLWLNSAMENASIFMSAVVN